MKTIEELAKEAYKVYGKTTGNKNFLGQQMPSWEDLPETIRLAWIAVARFLVLETTI